MPKVITLLGPQLRPYSAGFFSYNFLAWKVRTLPRGEADHIHIHVSIPHKEEKRCGFMNLELTQYRPAMPFGNRKIYFRGSFQFSIFKT